MILEVGGSMVSDQESSGMLLARLHIVWIKSSPFECMECFHTQGDLRPMAGNPQAMNHPPQILNDLEGGYRRVEHALGIPGKRVETNPAQMRDLIVARKTLDKPLSLCRKSVLQSGEWSE